MKALMLAAALALATPAAAPPIILPNYASPSYDIGASVVPALMVCEDNLEAEIKGKQGLLVNHIVDNKLSVPQAKRLIEVCTIYEAGAMKLATLAGAKP